MHSFNCTVIDNRTQRGHAEYMNKEWRRKTSERRSLMLTVCTLTLHYIQLKLNNRRKTKHTTKILIYFCALCCILSNVMKHTHTFIQYILLFRLFDHLLTAGLSFVQFASDQWILYCLLFFVSFSFYFSEDGMNKNIGRYLMLIFDILPFHFFSFFLCLLERWAPFCGL